MCQGWSSREVSARFSDFLAFCGMGLGVHVCWQTSGALQNLGAPKGGSFTKQCRHPRWAAAAHFQHSLLVESNPGRRRWRECPDRALCTHHKHSTHPWNAGFAQSAGISHTGRDTSLNLWCEKIHSPHFCPAWWNEGFSRIPHPYMPWCPGPIMLFLHKGSVVKYHWYQRYFQL